MASFTSSATLKSPQSKKKKCDANWWRRHWRSYGRKEANLKFLLIGIFSRVDLCPPTDCRKPLSRIGCSDSNAFVVKFLGLADTDFGRSVTDKAAQAHCVRCEGLALFASPITAEFRFNRSGHAD